MQSEDIVQQLIDFVSETGRLPGPNEPGLEQPIRAAVKTFGSLENALRVAGLLTNTVQYAPFRKKKRPESTQPSEPKNSFSSFPPEYFLNLLNLKRMQHYGSPAPDGTPTWWERRANAQYVCTSCRTAIEKGERYIGRKKLNPGQRGSYGHRGTYATNYYHIVCLLRNARTSVEDTIQKLDLEINNNQKEIVDFRAELSMRIGQAEHCRKIIEQARADYRQAPSLGSKIGKWFSTNYTSWSKNREILRLQGRMAQVENIEIPKRHERIHDLSNKKNTFQHRLAEIVDRIKDFE